MRVVLDTKVLVSGIFFKGPPMRILEAWAARKFELIVTLAPRRASRNERGVRLSGNR